MPSWRRARHDLLPDGRSSRPDPAKRWMRHPHYPPIQACLRYPDGTLSISPMRLPEFTLHGAPLAFRWPKLRTMQKPACNSDCNYRRDDHRSASLSALTIPCHTLPYPGPYQLFCLSSGNHDEPKQRLCNQCTRCIACVSQPRSFIIVINRLYADRFLRCLVSGL